MVQLQKDAVTIQDAGIQLIGISYDSPEILKTFTEKYEISFPLLSDPGSKTIDAYGLRNQDVRAGSRQDGIPHPCTVIVDRQGVVKAKLAYSVRKRHSTQELLDAAK